MDDLGGERVRVPERREQQHEQRAEVDDEQPAERKREQRPEPDARMPVEERREPPPRGAPGRRLDLCESRAQRLAPDLVQASFQSSCVSQVVPRRRRRSPRPASSSSRRPPTRPRRRRGTRRSGSGSSSGRTPSRLTGASPKPSATAACASGDIMWSIQRYMQFGFAAFESIIHVSDHPVVPSFGLIAFTQPAALRR